MLPSYTVRESRKAKHVSLKISLAGSLEVIVPPGFDQNHIPAILQRKQRWINQVIEQVEVQQALAGFEASNKLPDTIALRAIDETWTLDYRSTPLPNVRAVEQANLRLVLYGDITNSSVCEVALHRWIATKAQIHLCPWLHRVSQELNLPFERVSVREQKTRWGSCSGRRALSINCKLLFLPNQLVRYVFIHELCHTIHLNHSPIFWDLVSQYEPNYQQLDADLRHARYYVPLWMEEREKKG